MRTTLPAAFVTERTMAGTVVDFVMAWPSEFVVVISVARDAVSRAVVKTERVNVLPPDVIMVGTSAIIKAPLDVGTAKVLVLPPATYRVDKVVEVSAESGAESIAEAGAEGDWEAGEPVPVPGPVMPATLVVAGDTPPVGEATAALPEALPAEGTFVGDVEGVDTSESGTFVVIEVVIVVSRDPVPETMTTGVVTIVLGPVVEEEGVVIGAVTGAPG